MNGLANEPILLLVPIGCYLIGAMVAVAGYRRSGQLWSFLPALWIICGGLISTAVAVDHLLDPDTVIASGWSVTPYLDVTLRLDALAAWFLLVISIPAIAAACYGIGYQSSQHGSETPRSGIDALLATFVASMTMVILANDLLAFLFAWELMSILSFFLVIGDGQRAESRRAGFVYLVMTHLGTAFLFIAFLILTRQAESTSFDALRTAAGDLGSLQATLVFLLALVGFGTKAGLIPLHVWLPRAHPAAPSHVSALMSGVMVKTAIYGLIRFIWEFTGDGPGWWGVVLLSAGAISAVLGILYALMERDLKRILAYSTVEHIGIITMAIGVALMLDARGHQEAAALALLAALIHIINHSLFKSLVFFGAGAIQVATGTRDLERLGGLIRGMPRTAGMFLVGAVAIAALPPLNGFVGEWLLFKSLLQLGFLADTARIATLVAVAAAALALTGALALACFVRAFGVGFLGMPRSDAARNGREVGLTMQLGMGLLALLCLGTGLLPMIPFRLLQPVTNDLVGTVPGPIFGMHDALSTVASGRYLPLVVVAGLFLVGIVPSIVARLFGGPGRERISPTWVCGFELEPRMQYTATSFAKPIRLIFQQLIRPHRTVEIDRVESPYVVASVTYREGIHPVYERYAYRHAVSLLVGASRRLRILQGGSIRIYLAYIFVTLVVVLVLAR